MTAVTVCKIVKYTYWELSNMASPLVFYLSVFVISSWKLQPLYGSTSTMLVVSPPPTYILTFRLARSVLQ